ncbi:MAG TPA: AbrB/MazE/SpoVT family DNA-binding domain-containing protein [Candidatus Nanoarchaeia archaeon]|nr:AbrB/MazE/SpoVT family DNA-binding domain-containing protein [Candidatus Nanoarchaeia archaeon]
MKRKLVKQGSATLMISLPSKWIKLNELDKGSEIDLVEKDNQLIISKDINGTKKEIIINISSLTESSIRTIITNTYRIGYGSILLNYANKDYFKIINEVVNKNLIGFEIIKKSDKSCRIENITEPTKEQFDNIFSKVLSNINELYEVAVKNLEGGKEEFEDIERNIQKFDNFCRRVISKESLDNKELLLAFHTGLIHAQRDIYLMLKYIEKTKIKSDKNLTDLLKESRKMFDLLVDGYKNKDIKTLEKIHEKEKEIIYKKGYSLLEKSKEPVIIHHLLDSIRNLYLASSPLMGSSLVVRSY